MAHCLQRRSLGALETVARWALLPPGSWPKPIIRKWSKIFSKCQLLPRGAPFYQVYEVSQSRFLMLHEEVERDASENKAGPMTSNRKPKRSCTAPFPSFTKKSASTRVPQRSNPVIFCSNYGIMSRGPSAWRKVGKQLFCSIFGGPQMKQPQQFPSKILHQGTEVIIYDHLVQSRMKSEPLK